MKQLFTLLFFVYTLASCSSFIPTEIENGKLLGVLPMQYGKASYQVTKPVEANREEIFRQTRKWAAFHVYDPKQALAISDNMIGDVITTGRINKQTIKVGKMPVNLPSVTYAVSIEAFERSYRITLTNFHIEISPLINYPVEVRQSGINKKTVREQFRAIDQDIQSLINDIQVFVPAEVVQEH